MTKFNEALLQSMLEMLQRRDIDAERITSYDEVEKSDGYCETCYWEYTEVEINYVNSQGTTQLFNYSGSFADLIQELTRE